DSRSARAVISPAMPAPAISARKKSLQFLSVGGVRPRERRTPPATVARNHREGKLLAGPSDEARIASPDPHRPSAPGDVRERRAAVRGVRDDPAGREFESLR